MSNFDYVLGTKATDEELDLRIKKVEMFRERPITDGHFLYNLGLFSSSSWVAKMLFLNELYQLVLDIPGVIVEFGTWWGQNQVLFENLRAVYEPFNHTRRIIAFDSFEGYVGLTDNDNPDSDVLVDGGYATSEGYEAYLKELLELNESCNVLNYRKHDIVKGNVVDTVPQFFARKSSMVVALAYFDLGLYEPTKVCLEAIVPRLIPGSIIMLDEFNSLDAPGETTAFMEIVEEFDFDYEIRKSRYLTDRTIVKVKCLV